MIESTLQPALAALAAGSWQEAHDLLAAVADDTADGAVLEALGVACSWLDHPETVETRERAYRCYRAEGDIRGAARVAIALAFDHLTFRGESAVAQGWLALAARALADLALADGALVPEHGHLALWEADFALSVDGDPVVGETKAEEAVRIGRALGIADIELMGRAQQGVALVLQGRFHEGMRLLDSSAAAAMAGEIADPAYAGYAVCYVINACEMASDAQRAAQWCLRLDDHCRKAGLQALQQICRSEYAGVLVEQGDWERAEAEILVAAEVLARRRPGIAGEALVRLAELRRRQGRTDEAAQLFEQAEGHPRALLGLAALALDVADPQRAASLARRFVRRCPPRDKAFRRQGLEVLVAATAELGDLEAARNALAELTDASGDEARGSHLAGIRLSEALLGLADGAAQDALAAAEDAVDLYDRAGSPFCAARARALLARVLRAVGEETSARQEAEAAVRAFEQLGARGEADRARALLGRPPSGLTLTPREADVLRLVAEGLGTEAIAARLFLSRHTVHRHVANVFVKLEVRTRAAAVSKASSLRLI